MMKKPRPNAPLWAVLILILALAARLPDLGSYATADEPLWLEGSYWFAIGLTIPEADCPPVMRRDFATTGFGCTLTSGHPGVITTWSGGLGILLYDYLFEQNTRQAFLNGEPSTHANPTLFGLMRLPLALINALFVVAFYLLLTRLIAPRLALIAALLLSLHPFHVGLSRVLHHDAAMTTFTLLAVLGLIGYFLCRKSWWWLLLSALSTGLALLTKPVSLIVFPMLLVIICLRWWYQRPLSLSRLLIELIAWTIGVGLTTILFLPAVWVIPQQVIDTFIGENFDMISEGHQHYFLGTISDDPGVWYYPLGWLWHASPLEVIGLLLLPFALWQTGAWRRVHQQPVAVALTLFVLLLFVAATLSDKKMVRYVLPVFPIIGLAAAYGGVWLVDWGGQTFKVSKSLPILIGLILLTHGLLLWRYAPSQFTYANPLLGGPPVAANLMTVGWGEGLEQAATYLNQQPEAENLRVASWYNPVFQAYFEGQAVSFSDDGRAQLAADYVVFYINQIQREKPYRGLVDYFRQQEPLFRVPNSFSGQTVNWVELYQAPAATPTRGAPAIEGIARLLAHTAESTPQHIDLTLFLQILGPLPDDTTLGVALQDVQGQRWGQANPAETRLEGAWHVGAVVEWRTRLQLPPDLPRQPYRPWVAFQFTDGKIIAQFDITPDDIVTLGSQN